LAFISFTPMAVRISFLNQKGGVGKSTCSILVGAALQSAGYQVQFEDMDPQGSLAMWVSHVGKLVPLPEGVAPDVIICDTPGRIDVSASSPDPFFRDLISRSDRLVIVAEKSLFSTQASIPMVESVKQFMSPTARAMILFNKVRRRTLVGGQNEEEMGRDLGLPVLKNSLPLAAAYESTQIQGFSVVVSKNRERIFQLALEILR